MKPYNKPERYAVVRQTDPSKRFYANFRYLHTSLDEAQAEAEKLAAEHEGAAFYVIELHSVTGKRIKVQKPIDTEDSKDDTVSDRIVVEN